MAGRGCSPESDIEPPRSPRTPRLEPEVVLTILKSEILTKTQSFGATTCGMTVSRNHNSPAQWAAQGLLPRLRLPIRFEVRQTLQLRILQIEQLVEQQRERLAEQLLELFTIQLHVRLNTQVWIQFAIQVKTHVLAQVSTRLTIPLSVLPGVLLRILLDVQ